MYFLQKFSKKFFFGERAAIVTHRNPFKIDQVTLFSTKSTSNTNMSNSERDRQRQEHLERLRWLAAQTAEALRERVEENRRMEEENRRMEEDVRRREDEERQRQDRQREQNRQRVSRWWHAHHRRQNRDQHDGQQ